MPGFSARIGKTGALSFVIQYVDLSGVQRAYTLTPADFSDNQDSGNPDDARDVARAIKKRLAKDDGFDPIRARGQRRDNRRNVHTVGDLCAEWLRARASGKKSLAGDTSKINRYIKPALGRIPVVALGRDDVAALHRQIAAGDPDANPPIPPHRIMANRVVRLLSAMWALAGDGVGKGSRRAAG